MGMIHDFNNALEIWLARHGFANIEVCEGGDYQYYYLRHVIQWGMVTSERMDRDFAQFSYEYGLNYDSFNTSVLSFLHELGHAVTWSNFTEKEINLDSCAKEVITNGVDYWLLPTEFSATVWAINWANTHEKEFEELHNLFGKYFNLIYNNEDILEQINDWMDEVRAGVDSDLFIVED